MRVLILATTTGYQTRAFGDAAERLGVELVFATDRCHLIDDPWQDGAIAIRFYDPSSSVAAIVAAAAARPIDGIVVVGDRPAAIAAQAAQALGIPWHPPDAVAIATNKLRTRERLRDARLPVPFFLPTSISNQQPAISNGEVPFPCVLKPVALSGSRGVMRANDASELAAAIERLRALLQSPDIRAERNDAHDTALVEGFVPGREYAVEALMHDGALDVLAIFDKPDPLDGPFFEETIYVTPSRAGERAQRAIEEAIARAAAAIGLHHGPIHAECRVNRDGVFVLEVAPRPIGGLCARALRFAQSQVTSQAFGPQTISNKSAINTEQSAMAFEALLLRHALGEDVREWRRESASSGVMMIPIPRRGIYHGVTGVDAARSVPHVDDVRITAKADQLLLPLPEGASYLGFIFARATDADTAERALRAAHVCLQFAIAPEFPVLTAASIHYNHHHG